MSVQAGSLTSGKEAVGRVECNGSGYLNWWSDGSVIIREGRCPGCPNCADLREREARIDAAAAAPSELRELAPFICGVLAIVLVCVVAVVIAL